MLSSPADRPRGDRFTRAVVRGGLLAVCVAGAWFAVGLSSNAYAAEQSSLDSGLVKLVGGKPVERPTEPGGSITQPMEPIESDPGNVDPGYPDPTNPDPVGAPVTQPKPLPKPIDPPPAAEKPVDPPSGCQASGCEGQILPADPEPSDPTPVTDEPPAAVPAPIQDTLPAADAKTDGVAGDTLVGRTDRDNAGFTDHLSRRHAAKDAASIGLPDLWHDASLPMNFPAGLHGETPFAATGGGNAASGISALTGFVLLATDQASSLSSAVGQPVDEGQSPLPAVIATPSVSPD